MNSTNRYHFEYTSEEGVEGSTGFPAFKNVETTVHFDDGETWKAVMDEFVNFLSSIYGYQIDLRKHYGTK